MSTWMMVRGAPRSGATRAPRASAGVNGGGGFGVLLQPVDLGLEEADAIHELLEGPREGIGQVDLVEIDLPAHALAIARGDAAGYPNHHRVGRDLTHDDGACADAAACADREASEHAGTRSHDDVHAERGVPLLSL